MPAFIALVRALLLQALRNRVALVYGFVFPLLFLLGFHALYGREPVPLALHAGQFLTVTILGAACFGLPTSLVAERELGVWRLYALAPTARGVLVAATLAARLLLLAAGLVLQFALARALGMPAPLHAVDMLGGIAVVSLAFLGLGAAMAMLVTSVPAVQAVGQALFLPMLMIGGVAVPLASVPDWALPVSLALPGRPAVTVLQAAQTGAGLVSVGPALLVLIANAVAGFAVAVLMFRWEPALPGQRLRRPWALLLPVALWIGASLWLGSATRAVPTAMDTADAGQVADYLVTRASSTAATTPAPDPLPASAPASVSSPSSSSSPSASATSSVATPVEAPSPTSAPAWRDVTAAELADVAYDRLPPDAGLVAPVAADDEVLDPLVEETLAGVAVRLPDWPPSQVRDPEQRVRNLLYVAAVPDLLQMEGIERGLPRLLLEVLQRELPGEDLPKLLYFIATHPDAGDDAAIGTLAMLGLPSVRDPSASTRSQLRGRVMLYAFKLLGRVTGNLPAAAQRRE